MWQMEVHHSGLNLTKIVRGHTEYEVEKKAEALYQQWEERWQKKLAIEERKTNKENMKAAAEAWTIEAENEIENLEHLLHNALRLNYSFKWENYKDYSKFNEETPPKLALKPLPSKPQNYFVDFIGEPDKKNYEPKFNLIEKLFKNLQEKKINQCKLKYEDDLKDYYRGCKNYEEDLKKWEIEKEKVIKANQHIEQNFANLIKVLEETKTEFYENQKKQHEHIEQLKKEYFNKSENATIWYFSEVLSLSKYPDYFPSDYEVFYNSNTGMLLVDYKLPIPEDIPNIKGFKFILSKNIIEELYLSAKEIEQLYDTVIYQIILRTLYEIYMSDKAEAINSVVLNGNIEKIDKATGKNVQATILSIQASRKEFLDINFEFIDPRECFKKLKGIGSAKLHTLTPVLPLIQINKEDKRFIESRSVISSIDDTINLAAMDWDAFEHLVREILEKEFVVSGGEVKVTQASRDGGVDAIAFDPDPLRGGKIVIQAKRYTNTVDVSAVRDLYGTLISEGASRGILVTTSDYGADSYEFAKNKPIQLLNGGHLLHLLEKHGHKAKIDLFEAKKILSQQKEKK